MGKSSKNPVNTGVYAFHLLALTSDSKRNPSPVLALEMHLNGNLNGNPVEAKRVFPTVTPGKVVEFFKLGEGSHLPLCRGVNLPPRPP
jgi:hypothetical protein